MADINALKWQSHRLGPAQQNNNSQVIHRLMKTLFAQRKRVNSLQNVHPAQDKKWGRKSVSYRSAITFRPAKGKLCERGQIFQSDASRAEAIAFRTKKGRGLNTICEIHRSSNVQVIDKSAAGSGGVSVIVSPYLCGVKHSGAVSLGMGLMRSCDECLCRF